jgi:hypothetical protein
MRLGRLEFLLISGLVFLGILVWFKISQHSVGSAERENMDIISLQKQLETKLESLDSGASPDSEKPRIAYEAYALSMELGAKGIVDINTLDAAEKAAYYRAKPFKDIATDLENLSNLGLPKDMVKNIEVAIADIKKQQAIK